MSAAAFILARAGSKGLPGKNIKPLMGKPLIVWSIEAAQNCADISTVIVSTDGEDIAAVAKAAGARVMMRPEVLANDTAMPKDAIRFHLEAMAKDGERPSIVVLMQPTSPLRGAQDITACVEAVRDGGYDSAATFVPSPSSPYRAWRDDEEGGLRPFVDGYNPWLPRQVLPQTYALNGAVYASKTQLFLADNTNSFLPGKAKRVVMPPERSIDIDTALDFTIAQAVMSQKS